jgi:hypothetical protein
MLPDTLESSHLGRLLWRYTDWAVKLTTNLYLVQSLVTRGSVSPLLPFAFMGCPGSTVLLLLRCYVTFVPENERQSFTVLGTVLGG